jgi:cyanophycin synthetase
MRESERVRLGPSTGIVEEASRNIPWIRLGTNSLVQLGHGINQMRFQLQLPARPAV